MSTFTEKLAAAKESRPTKDVHVVLDAELAAEREKIVAEIEAAKKNTDDRLAAKSPVDVLTEKLEALNDAAEESLVTFRFTRLPGREWSALTSKNPVRIDVPIDRRYGYNFDAVCEAAAVASGVRVDGDDQIPLTLDEWTDLFDALSGNEFGLIRDAVWSLNEWEPQQRVGELVKAFGAAARSEKN
jgi:hypothetical protein